MRPLVFGYLRCPAVMPTEDMNPVRGELTTFAAAEGFTLADIYADQADTAPAAFHALVDAVRRHNAWGVVVPSLYHLGGPELPAMKNYLQRHTGARVIVARSPDSGLP